MSALEQKLLPALRRLSQWAVWGGGVMLLCVSLLVAVDVVARRLLGSTVFSIANEMSSYAFAIATSWSLSFVLFERANVRIDVFYMRLSIRMKAVLNVLALVFLGSFILFLSWRAVFLIDETLRNNTISVTPLATPMIIPQSLWALGYGLFLVSWTALLVHGVVEFVRGRYDTVNRWMAPNSVEM